MHQATVSGQASYIVAATGTAAGTSTADGQAQQVAAQETSASAAGQATVSGASGAIKGTAGSAAGTSTVLGVITDQAASGSDAQAAGLATVEGQAAAIFAAEGHAAGSSSATGQAAKVAAAIMEARPHPEQGYRSCLGLMRLGEEYGRDRLEAASRRALAAGTSSYQSVKSILKTGLDKLALEPEEARKIIIPIRHPNIRGPDEYQ